MISIISKSCLFWHIWPEGLCENLIHVTVAAVDDLDTELISSDASYTVTCNYKGTDEPDSVSWTVGGSVVSNSDDDIEIAAGTLNSETNERSAISAITNYRHKDKIRYMNQSQGTSTKSSQIALHRKLATILEY